MVVIVALAVVDLEVTICSILQFSVMAVVVAVGGGGGEGREWEASGVDMSDL